MKEDESHNSPLLRMASKYESAIVNNDDSIESQTNKLEDMIQKRIQKNRDESPIKSWLKIEK